jgi:stearoyl-CoA desaturase (Delta-9 desaturase)
VRWLVKDRPLTGLFFTGIIIDRSSDRSGDPHSPIAGFEMRPLRGLLHAHFGWIHKVGIPTRAHGVADILRDPIVKWIGRAYPWIPLVGIVTPAIASEVHYGTLYGAWRGIVWGGAARLFLVNNIIWSINSVCHLWGAQRYRTSDWSRNSWWLAVPSLGEAWHNNHHVAAGAASFGHTWWELDLGYYVIVLLRGCRIVSGVSRVPRALLEKKTRFAL